MDWNIVLVDPDEWKVVQVWKNGGLNYMVNNKTHNGLKEKKTALITGSSSGIGYEFSKLFAQDGYNLVLVARNKQKLKQLADELEGNFGISVKIISKDWAT